MTLFHGVFSAVLLLGTALPGFLAAQPASSGADAREKELAQIKADYTKYEYRIPMRDGQRLFTSVFVPQDQSQKLPLLLTRTPYTVRPYGADQYRANLGQSALFAKPGYIVVYQDVRRRWMSEVQYADMR